MLPITIRYCLQVLPGSPNTPKPRTLRRIVVLFPAYKEDRVIVASIQSFLEQDYPKELYEIIVIFRSDATGNKTTLWQPFPSAC